MEKKCGCGNTKNADGFCDGSHNNKVSGKEIPFNQITVRVISTGEPQRVKNVFPAIANNKSLMKNMGFVISDPRYDAKMEAFKNKKPYSENGKPKDPQKEAFISNPGDPTKEVKTDKEQNKKTANA